MTIGGNNNKLIKDWIRLLQKSLTIETENKFINTLGREKYFNDYLHESLSKIDNLDISDANIAATILKIQEKKTQRGNSYAIVKFSDRKTVFELFCNQHSLTVWSRKTF